jgi:SDR family mycofactocin-dependent oxidoreductase
LHLKGEKIMGLLQDKIVFITGAAWGLGRAHALASAREGADVVLLDIVGQVKTAPYKMPTPADLEDTKGMVEALGRRALTVEGDVRSQEALNQAVAKGISEFGKIDALIANQGIWNLSPFWEMEESAWDEMLAINLTGHWKAAKAVAPHMIERQSGSIVFISSTNGLEGGPGYSHYTAAKHGVLGLMKSAALELARYGVRCNAVCPGSMKTPMTNHQEAWNMYAGNDAGTEADLMEGGYHYHALKGLSFMDPTLVANAAVFLNSDLATAVTGVALPADAGHMALPGFNSDPVRA